MTGSGSTIVCVGSSGAHCSHKCRRSAVKDEPVSKQLSLLPLFSCSCVAPLPAECRHGARVPVGGGAVLRHVCEPRTAHHAPPWRVVCGADSAPGCRLGDVGGGGLSHGGCVMMFREPPLLHLNSYTPLVSTSQRC